MNKFILNFHGTFKKKIKEFKFKFNFIPYLFLTIYSWNQ